MAPDPERNVVSTADEVTLVCREVVELMTSYLEGALDAESRAQVQAHLHACHKCATYLEQMRETVRFLRGLDANGLTSQTTQLLLARFRSWRALAERDA